MSFMFKPYPFDDMNAVNEVSVNKEVSDRILFDNSAIKDELLKALNQDNASVLAIDGYPTCDFEKVESFFLGYRVIHTADLYKDSKEIEDMLRSYLPEDKKIDPPLLYGRLFTNGLKNLMREDKVEEVLSILKEKKEKIVLIGHGALIDEFLPFVDVKVYMDISPKEAALRCNRKEYINIGDKVARPFKALMRRNYYVDFESEVNLRKKLVENKILDYYIFADDREHLVMLPYADLDVIFEEMSHKPFRCKPVYLEGVWGGFFMMRERNLPKTMKNCSWIFDMIPSEVSIVAIANGKRVEVPFYTYVHAKGINIMGRDCVDYFKGYFPIRFNYDDTWHSNGNMSIQCHPYDSYIKKMYGELGRQDESYYIVEAAEGAKTFLGFKKGADPDEFMAKVKESEKSGEKVDYLKYVNAVESKAGTQVIIPAGTIHSSGRNQLILEIGSLTIGSYTYKLYDYLRKDLDGNPRPIHSYCGDEVLQKYRDTDFVNKHLVRQSTDFTDDDTVIHETLGESPLLYFKLETEQFLETYEDETKGNFHVLTLTNGEKVKIYDKDHPERFFICNYLDIVCVPSTIHHYVIENMGKQPVTIHKTSLREDFLQEKEQYIEAFNKKERL